MAIGYLAHHGIKGQKQNDYQNKVSKAPVIILNPQKTLRVVGISDITDELRSSSKETIADYKKLGKDWVDKYVYNQFYLCVIREDTSKWS